MSGRVDPVVNIRPLCHAAELGAKRQPDIYNGVDICLFHCSISAERRWPVFDSRATLGERVVILAIAIIGGTCAIAVTVYLLGMILGGIVLVTYWVISSLRNLDLVQILAIALVLAIALRVYVERTRFDPPS